MATTKYFCGDVELKGIHPQKLARFIAVGGTKSAHNRYDGFSRLVGHPVSGPDAIYPVTRTIFYKSNPSLHKCGSKCRSAKGHDCECSCGGECHGIDA